MARHQLPTSFTAGKKVKLAGTTYNPGDVIAVAVVKAAKRASALLSNGMVRPNRDMWHRRGKPATRRPNQLTPADRKNLS